jgi:hypothetical protein
MVLSRLDPLWRVIGALPLCVMELVDVPSHPYEPFIRH